MLLRTVRNCAVSLACLFASLTIANASVILPPEPISTPGPKIQEYSTQLQEAWGQFRYSIKEDGTTTDIETVGGFYNNQYLTLFTDALRSWKYKPATEDGKPIRWNGMEQDLVVYFRDIRVGAEAPFIRKLGQVNKLIDQKDYAGAKTLIDDIIKNNVTLLYEYGLIQTRLFTVEVGLNHPQAALDAIRRATPELTLGREAMEPRMNNLVRQNDKDFDPNGILPTELLGAALTLRFSIEYVMGRYTEALHTYDRVVKVSPQSAEGPVTEQANAMRQALASDAPLIVHGQIQNGSWEYKPERRSFTIPNVKGQISQINVRCERRVTALAFQADVEWAIPEAWGKCFLDVQGTEGTQFTLVEFKGAGQKQSNALGSVPVRAFAGTDMKSLATLPAFDAESIRDVPVIARSAFQRIAVSEGSSEDVSSDLPKQVLAPPHAPPAGDEPAPEWPVPPPN